MSSSQSANKRIVLSSKDWNPSNIKYMKPKISDRGSKTISIISTQTNRMLHISTPMLMTWGISDYTDDMGKSDGKYTISLNFPNEEYKTEDTDLFLQKMKDFENQVLDDAVSRSEEWWGESMSRDVCKHTFFPTLKYSKNKETKRIDYSKPPTFRAKVPCYDGSWKVEIYDINSQLVFPNEDPTLTPIDFVPKLSNVACLLQCTGIWIGGKGWGVTWKLFQCVVKPRENYTIQGCCIDIPTDLRNSQSKSGGGNANQFSSDCDEMAHLEPEFPTLSTPTPPPQISQNSRFAPLSKITEAEDTDDDEEVPPTQEVIPSSPPVQETIPEVVNAPEEQEESIPVTKPAKSTNEQAKKKIIKKKT